MGVSGEDNLMTRIHVYLTQLHTITSTCSCPLSSIYAAQVLELGVAISESNLEECENRLTRVQDTVFGVLDTLEVWSLI